MDNLSEMANRLILEIIAMRSILPTYLHLIVSAVFPIYVASHASLSRPKSAPKPPKAKTTGDEPGAEDEDDDERVKQVEGFSPTDAIILPVTAGLVLSGLYFLIKWLEDPAILNKILGWYFGIAGTFAVSSLLSDSLRNMHAFTFPTMYRKGKVWYEVNGQTEEAKSLPSTGSLPAYKSPLPGLGSSLPLPESAQSFLWKLHSIADHKFEINFRAHSFGVAKTRFDLFDTVGVVCGLSASLYANLIDCPWWLTNLLGTALSYGALQLMSPTTFTTGSMILSALFVYDIVMVFYTPMMVTVAKSLDVPIKLMFPQPTPDSAESTPAKPSYAMLGLGDVVLPGIMIGLALRFDLYLYYSYKNKIAKSKEQGGETVARYVAPSKHWGNRFWTSNWLLQASRPAPENIDLGYFPKPYFHSAMTGYIVGLVVTLISMQISRHPQPALLYLVPGVVGALWSTAYLRGEVKGMWEFSEATDEEEADGKQSEVKNGETASKESEKVRPQTKDNIDTEENQKHDDQHGSAVSQLKSASPNKDVKTSKADQDRETLLALTITKVNRRKTAAALT